MDAGAKLCAFAINRCHEQSESVLFSIIPAEIREHIFSYALTESEDTTKLYDIDTCYRRPGHLAPRITHTALLRTCQRIYREAWYMPWVNAQHSLYLASAGRRPDRSTSIEEMQKTLTALHENNIDTLINHVQIFAQLYALEPGNDLQEILDMEYFHPRTLTITVRHTDFWFWESDVALHIDADWVNDCRFPDSLQQLKLQFESLERKKSQVDSLASQVVNSWHFLRHDGTMMVSDMASIAQTRWTGSSTWEGQRWLRDETRPEELDYYIVTVTFRPLVVPDDHVVDVIENERIDAEPTAQLLTQFWELAVVSTEILQEAGIPRGMSAWDVRKHITEMTRRRRNS